MVGSCGYSRAAGTNLSAPAAKEERKRQAPCFCCAPANPSLLPEAPLELSITSSIMACSSSLSVRYVLELNARSPSAVPQAPRIHSKRGGQLRGEPTQKQSLDLGCRIEPSLREPCSKSHGRVRSSLRAAFGTCHSISRGATRLFPTWDLRPLPRESEQRKVR